MATDLSAFMTMVEFANQHKNKMLLDIVKTMKANPLVTDAKWVEGNGLKDHTFDRAVSYTSPSVRQFNAGVVPSIGQTQPYTEPIRSFEKHINIDEKYEKFEGSFEQFRWQREMLQMEGFSREFMRLFLYGNSADVQGEVDGLFTRYADPALANVHDEGSTSDGVCSSALMVKWGPGGLYLVYPQGSSSNGIVRDPRGKALVVTNSNTGAQAWFWNTVMTLDFGICVEKDVAVQRLGSIDTTDTIDPDHLIDMAANIMEEYGTYDDVVLYVNARGWSQLWKESNSTPGLFSKTVDPFGTPVWAFDGIPIKIFGGLTTTENDI
jgi:hypothetical protein